MPNGKMWTASNLAVEVAASYCYGDDKAQCDRSGRLYTWEAARLGCRSLGPGWRLPSQDDWQELAGLYGGVDGDSADGGAAAYRELMVGGSSGFQAILGGGRDGETGTYARLDAHGLYWTGSATGADTAWFINFGKNGLAVHRHADGDKRRALSVRCIKD